MKRLGLTSLLGVLFTSCIAAFAQTISSPPANYPGGEGISERPPPQGPKRENRVIKSGLLAPSAQDRTDHRDFLTQRDTGLIRLLPREVFGWRVYKTPVKLHLRGGGAYYSEQSGGSCELRLCGAGYHWETNPICDCVPDSSPIIMQFTHGAKLDISDAKHGILFDLDLMGRNKKQMIGAPVDFTTTGFLYLKGEDTHSGLNLFGDRSPQQKIEGVQPNGFLGLADWDDPMFLNGQIVGPKDNKITHNDGVWNLLRVWFDYNRDGLLDPGELKTLDELGVYQIDLDYKVSGRKDAQGNRLTFKSNFWITGDPAPYVATDYFADTIASK